MNNIEILLILSILPVILMIYIIYKNDKIEKEPASLLIKLFFSGILAVVLTTVITMIIYVFIPSYEDYSSLNIFELIPFTFISVGLVEEGSKWIFLKSMTWKNKEFNYIYDAIVYAVMVSLGFACLENIIYVFDGGIVTAITRAIFSIPGHTFFGVFMGFYYGLAKQSQINNNKQLENKNIVLSLLIPTLLHGLFDYLIFSQLSLFTIVYMIFIIILYITAIKKIKRFSNIKVSLENNNSNNKRYCQNCGTEVTGNFCRNCGHKI